MFRSLARNPRHAFVGIVNDYVGNGKEVSPPAATERKKAARGKRKRFTNDIEEDEESDDIETYEKLMSELEVQNEEEENDDDNSSFYVNIFTQNFSYPLEMCDVSEHITITNVFVYIPKQKKTICINSKRREYRSSVTIWSFLKQNHRKKSQFVKYVDGFVSSLKDASKTGQAPIPSQRGFVKMAVNQSYFFCDRSGDLDFVSRFWEHMKTVVLLLTKGVKRYPWNAAMIALDYGNGEQCAKRAERLKLRESLKNVILPAKKECVHMTMKNFLERYETKRDGHQIRYLEKLGNQSVTNLYHYLRDLTFE